MSTLDRCVYCGKGYCKDIPEDVMEHQKFHTRKELAEKVFGHIATYAEREQIKDNIFERGTDRYLTGGRRQQYYAWWCRSIEACNFDVKHPSLQEYIDLSESKSPLMNGSYVNMKKYKQNNNLENNLECIKPGVIYALPEIETKDTKFISIYIPLGSRLKIIDEDNSKDVNAIYVKVFKDDESFIGYTNIKIIENKSFIIRSQKMLEHEEKYDLAEFIRL